MEKVANKCQQVDRTSSYDLQVYWTNE